MDAMDQKINALCEAWYAETKEELAKSGISEKEWLEKAIEEDYDGEVAIRWAQRIQREVNLLAPLSVEELWGIFDGFFHKKLEEWT
jgi:hypothetical protein